ncbi:Chitobiase/beta-hexosaminidase C-terminal domain-containing protein [Salegentibacter holothuriorum]|uniref:beta-N-acetylhexosaminidase n=1 Tax=Salegentibacter holothuriorum TaxID=241145 RepID=A0A1T5DK13_9FLAO|nr:glycoside hydrolase family 20 zincin-like fold domain-containing protein [Salegentibacter holothuriorum]SKB71773.1 Chitobiase/beta-hexosaminidase C-terminal domain-containing protein [Salegentibacter holothuriorum]
MNKKSLRNKMSIAIPLILFGFLFSGMQAQEITVIPKPQELISSETEFSLEKTQDLWINSSKHNDFALQQLKDELTEQMGVASEVVKSPKKASIILYALEENPDSKIKKYLPNSEKLQEIGEQGYWLKIEENQIKLIANTEKGLFYGVQTLRQLIKTAKNKSLPALEITDWPALEYRGWMDDISRGPIPTLDFIKNAIRKLSQYKLNFLNLYTEHTLRNEKFADIAPLDSFTPEEINELEEFAAQYHVVLIGNQQAFGHMEEILKNPFYDEIADNKWNLNPGSPATYEFLDEYLGDAAQAYDHPFFNIGADETDGLGSGKAKALVDSLGMEAVYAMHINKLDEILKKHGKRTMMWGDIAVNHQEIIDLLPKDLIILSWGYDPRDSFDQAIIPFKESGFDFMVAPGVRNWSEIYPNLDVAVKNIANYVRDGKEYGAMGMINTAWDDDGETLFNANWHGIIWGAEMAWNPTESQEETQAKKEREGRLSSFNKAMDQLFFDMDNGESIMKSLNKFRELREIPVFGSMSNASIWGSIFDFYPKEEVQKVKDANKLMLKEASALAKELEGKIAKTNSEKIVVQVAQNAAERAAFAAKKNLFILDLQEAHSNPNAISKDEIKQTRDELFKELHQLKIDYINLWQAENREYWLTENLNKYDETARELLDLETHVFIDSGQAIRPGEMEISLSTLYPGTEIRYTTNGGEPTRDSALYEGALSVTENAEVKARAFKNTKVGEISAKYFNVHKALGAKPKIKGRVSTANPAYAAGGPGGLTDGLKGSEDFGDGRWQGYAGQDIEVVLDLKAKTEINEISADFFQRLISWIMLPESVEFYVSNDGKEFRKIAVAENNIDPQKQGLIIENFSSGEIKEKARYIKVLVKSMGPLPEWHTGSGKSSFIFLDEIIVK